MVLIERLQPDFNFTDERGTLTQLVHSGYKQVNIVFTKAGATRGRFHYHKENRELFFIITGKVLVCAEKDGICEKNVFTAGDMFAIPPHVRHSFQFLENTYLAGMYSGCVEKPDGTKDIYEN